MGRKKFRLRRKPKKPSKTTYPGERINVYPDSFFGVDIGNLPEGTKLYCEEVGQDIYQYFIVKQIYEPLKDYERKLRFYEEAVDKWEKWYKENKEAIKAELALREKETGKKIMLASND